MRLNNFTILAGNAANETDEELISTGSVSPTDVSLESHPDQRYTFSSNFGNEDTESPYGNVHAYNTAYVSTETELSITQSLGTRPIGTAKSSFISIMNSTVPGG
jgi:hypothetical protein